MIVMAIFVVIWCVVFWAILGRISPVAPAGIDAPLARRAPRSEVEVDGVEWGGPAPTDEVVLQFFGDVPSVEEALAAQYDAIARKRKVSAPKPKSPAEAARAAKAVHRGPLEFRSEPQSSIELDTKQSRIDDAVEFLLRDEDRADEHDPTL